MSVPIDVTGDSNPTTDNTELQRLRYSEQSRNAEGNVLSELSAKADIEVRRFLRHYSPRPLVGTVPLFCPFDEFKRADLVTKSSSALNFLVDYARSAIYSIESRTSDLDRLYIAVFGHSAALFDFAVSISNLSQVNLDILTISSTHYDGG